MLNGLHRREAPSERPFKLRHEVIGVGDAGGYGEFGTFEWHCQSSRTLSLGDSDTPPATVQALELTAPGGFRLSEWPTFGGDTPTAAPSN
jgi:hypothetical protein